MIPKLVALDQQLFLILNNSFAHPLLDVVMGVFTQMGTVRIIYPILVIAAYVADKRNFSENLALLSSILFIEIFIGTLLKDVIGRPRPMAELASLVSAGKVQIHTLYLIEQFPFFTSEPPGLSFQSQLGIGNVRDLSFPSGHAQIAAAVATYLTYLKPQRGFYYFSAMLVASFARVYAGAHYPLDIFMGMILGIAIATALIWIIAGRTFSEYSPFKRHRVGLPHFS